MQNRNIQISLFTLNYGLITLYKNDVYIGGEFKNVSLLKLRNYIDPNRNMLEIGRHCGTSSIYSSFLNKQKIYVYEPQFNIIY